MMLTLAALTWEAAVSLVAVALPITAAILSRRPANQGVTKGDLAGVERQLNKRIDDLREDVRELRRFLHDRF